MDIFLRRSLRNVNSSIENHKMKLLCDRSSVNATSISVFLFET